MDSSVKPVRFSWRGVKPGRDSSMWVVDRENISALESLGWIHSQNPHDAEVIISFTHQGPGTLLPDTSGRLRIFYFCTTSHNALLKSNMASLKSISNTSNNFIFVLNETMRANFRDAGIECHVWNHGVNREHFKPAHNPPNHRLVFGFVGQSSTFKRREFLVDCFDEAFRGHPDNAELRMMTSANLQTDLDKITADIRIIPHQPHEQLPAFYQNLDCLVTFSCAEGYNMPPLEALASGVPCIVPDMPEMYEDPYDRLCIHVPARRTTSSDVLLDTHFAPVDLNAYHAPPWIHKADRDAAVRALREFTRGPPVDGITERQTWLGRIRSQVLPIIEQALCEVA